MWALDQHNATGYLKEVEATELFEEMVQVGQLLAGLVRALKRHRA